MNKPLTVREATDLWMAKFKSTLDSPIQYNAIRYTLETSFLAYLGEKEVDSIDSASLSELFDLLRSRGKAETNIANLKGLLQLLFEFLHNAEILTYNPMKCLPPKGHICEYPFSDEQITDLRKAFEKSIYGNLLGFCLYSGLGRADLLVLSWDDIDFENKLIYTRKRKVYSSNNVDYTIQDLSLNPRVRPLTEEAAIYLLQQKDTQRLQMTKADKWWQNPENLVFTDKVGMPLSISAIDKAFCTIRKHSGVSNVNLITLQKQYKCTVIERNLSCLC